MKDFMQINHDYYCQIRLKPGKTFGHFIFNHFDKQFLKQHVNGYNGIKFQVSFKDDNEIPFNNVPKRVILGVYTPSSSKYYKSFDNKLIDLSPDDGFFKAIIDICHL